MKTKNVDHDRDSKATLFRGSYSPRGLAAELSERLVGETIIERIIEQVGSVLKNSLKPTSASVFLYNGPAVACYDAIGKTDMTRKHIINKTLAYQNVTTIVVSAGRPNHKEPFAKNLVQLLRDENIAVSVRLVTNNDLVGFLLLGVKKSGGIYKNKDINFLYSVAKTLSIVLQNAKHFEELKEINTALQQETIEIKKELNDTNQKLKALDEAKDEFISMASHQLRTPLTSVKGNISMLLEGDGGEVSDKQRDMLKAAYTSSQRMVYLIADFLNVSRLKTGKFLIEKREVYLPDLVAEEVEQLVEPARSRGLEIEYNKLETFPMLMLDEEKTRQVIMNFIDNAIYYSDSGKIRVELGKSENMIEFKVIDEGMGVPKEVQKDLFTKFFRAENAKSARPDGTGLGLFMAKKIIVAQGGAILFSSKEGEGSTFGFTFPLPE